MVLVYIRTCNISFKKIPPSDQIEKHSATLDRENPRDFIDVYLTAMEEDEGLNKDDLAINLFDFLLAGSETSSTTLKWLVLYLTLYQEVQAKCREEILRVIGANRCRLEDIVSLPYTQVSNKILNHNKHRTFETKKLMTKPH